MSHITRKQALCGILQVTLCSLARCITADKRGAMLSREAFAKAEAFIYQTARPLEQALYAYYFKYGHRDAVMAELANFQNRDGGFASCLESDTRWRGSSPLGAMKALHILTDAGAPASDLRVKAVIEYLLARFDTKQARWHALPKEANSAPHAGWWDVNAETGKCEVESAVFPTAALAGYLQEYAALLPARFEQPITKSSLNFLATAPVQMKMPDIESLIELVRFLPTSRSREAVRKLKTVLAVMTVQNPEQWNSYNVKPLTFVHSPQSPLYAGPGEAVAKNLDYIISTQRPDGGWGLTWSWEQRNPAAWKVAEREWRGVVTLENLQTLKAFHRIAEKE